MVLLGVLFLLALLSVPIAFAMGAATVLQFLSTGDAAQLAWIPRRVVDGLASYPLLAVPFFILAAEIMNGSLITNRIFAFAKSCVGHIRGGLGHVNVMASVMFSGMSGSAIADTAGLGKVQIPEMKEQGFDAPFSAAVTAASATIGPIIPPSIPLVIFGVVAEESIARLLIAGLLPGLVLAALMFLAVWVSALRSGYPALGKASLQERASAGRKAALPLLMPIILVGGILSGVFTPTEAAFVAVAYALVLAVLVYRMDSWGDLRSTFEDAAMDASKILIVVGMAYPVSLALTTIQAPQRLVELLLSMSVGPGGFIVMTIVTLLLIGCFMESVSAMIIVVPILMPPALEYGIDPIHLGVVVVLTLMIGLVTPPFGLGMFIACEIADVGPRKFVVAMVPFYCALGLGLAIVAAVPQL